jgi:hypothetical protein
LTGIVTIRHHEVWYRRRTSCRRNWAGEVLPRSDRKSGGLEVGGLSPQVFRLSVPGSHNACSHNGKNISAERNGVYEAMPQALSILYLPPLCYTLLFYKDPHSPRTMVLQCWDQASRVACLSNASPGKGKPAMFELPQTHTWAQPQDPLWLEATKYIANKHT